MSDLFGPPTPDSASGSRALFDHPELGRSPAASVKRVDLHCHSDASNIAGEAVLKAIHCPESYSRPEDVYAQALRRGMDFVTLTDHDTIDGALRISQMPGVLVGEELTCWFPEDNCKMHVLVFGIDARQHQQLQSLSRDIYRVAEYLEAGRIAHSVAHPIYRQNDKLERWHLERLILLFKGFECLNGAHSRLHREAFEPVLDGLTAAEIWRLAEAHRLRPRWNEPWIKARTAGSDDHGLLNVGRTWTEFPAATVDAEDLLECLRRGNCRPGGEPGSSIKLAHTLYGVAVRYYTNHMMSPGQQPGLATSVLQTIVGQSPPPKRRHIAAQHLRGTLSRISAKVLRPIRRPPPTRGASTVARAFLESARKHFAEHPELRNALTSGLPPLGEHEDMFALVADVNRDVTAAVVDAFTKAIEGPSFTGIFDAIAAVLAQQFTLMPYYFACFHQNKERHLLRRITRLERPIERGDVRIGLFTDTLDDMNGVSRFIRDMAVQSARLGRNLTIHTSATDPHPGTPGRQNFKPLFSAPLPYYPQISLTLPPLLEILQWADRQQFDAIHVSTPGPMGLCGWMVSKMLRVPLLATYHTDFPAYVERLAGDHRLTGLTNLYMKWFYGQADAVFSRSREYLFNLGDLGLPESSLHCIPPGVDTEKFNPSRRDPAIWSRLGVSKPRRLLYAGRVSVEKNLPLLVRAVRELCSTRNDVALVVAGDGPYLATMRQECRDLPVRFLGVQDDEALSALYASADLLVFPSRTDTLGQVVMEAHASGLPVLVSDQGGPKEMTGDGITGRILAGEDPAAWSAAIASILDDELTRLDMARAGPKRIARLSLTRCFESFWADHVSAVERSESIERATEPMPLHAVPL